MYIYIYIYVYIYTLVSVSQTVTNTFLLYLAPMREKYPLFLQVPIYIDR